MLLHDGGGDRAETVAALDRLLTELGPQGFQFPTVSEGLRLPPGNPEAPRGDQIRGQALACAQRASGWLADAMTVLLAVAIGLAVLRLVIQVTVARIQVRRVRARPPNRCATSARSR